MIECDEAEGLLADPPLRTDGGCAHCGKPRRPERSAKYGGVAAELDPFCAAECARAWHGTPVRSVEREPARG